MLLDFYALLGAGETQWKKSWLLAQGPGNQEVFLDRLHLCGCGGKELVFELQLEFGVWLCLQKEEPLSRVPAIYDGCPDVRSLGKAPMGEHLLALQCEETKVLVPTLNLTMWPFLIYLSLF